MFICHPVQSRRAGYCLCLSVRSLLHIHPPPPASDTSSTLQLECFPREMFLGADILYGHAHVTRAGSGRLLLSSRFHI